MLLPAIAGCSALRLTYNQGPTLAYWWLDGYADFGDEQTPRVKAALADWFAWHRATQLPEYGQALAKLGNLAVKPVTASQLCALYADWQQRALRAFDQAVPALADEIRTLSAEQIDHLERRLATAREDRATEYLQAQPAEREKAALKRAIDRAETLYGTLDERQQALMAAALEVSPFEPERWMAELKQRHAEIVRSLRQWRTDRADATAVQAGLRRLAGETLASPRTDYRAYSQRVVQANCALAAQVHNGTTPAQRQHAVDRLKGWQDDLRALNDPR